MKKFYSIFLIIILSLLLVSFSNKKDIVINIQPEEIIAVDALIINGEPNSNYQNYPYCNVGEQDNGNITGRCFIKFSLLNIVPPNSLISNITLSLFEDSENSSNNTVINIYNIDKNWVESQVTWNSYGGGNWTNPGGDYDNNIIVSSRNFSSDESPGEKVFFINPSVFQELLDGSSYGFLIKTQNESNDLYRFWSSSSTISSNRPKITVAYTLNGVATTVTSTSILSSPTNIVLPSETLTPHYTVTPTLADESLISESLQGWLHIFIIAGQSNGSGRGSGSSCFLPSDNIYNFGNDYRWKILCEPSDNAYEQVDSVSNDGDNAGYSFASSFAANIKEAHPNWGIAIINCSMGGSYIKEWKRSLLDNTLYGQCLKRVGAASILGKVEGVLFFQGESDSIVLSDASVWDINFTQFVFSLRQDLGNVPIIFAQLGSQNDYATFPYWNTVKNKQSSINLKCVSMILTDDLNQVGPHFLSSGYDVIGKRFADYFLSSDSC